MSLLGLVNRGWGRFRAFLPAVVSSSLRMRMFYWMSQIHRITGRFFQLAKGRRQDVDSLNGFQVPIFYLGLIVTIRNAPVIGCGTPIESATKFHGLEKGLRHCKGWFNIAALPHSISLAQFSTNEVHP